MKSKKIGNELSKEEKLQMKKDQAEREKLQKNPKKHGEVYYHVSNSGVTFGVVDKGFGPTIIIDALCFGHKFGQIQLHVMKKDLKHLAKLFANACKQEYSKDYCCAAEVIDNTTLKTEEASDEG
jgi:hypothetical protein